MGNGVDGLHGGEKQDFLDVGGIGQEHDQTVDSKTESSSRRKTVLETVCHDVFDFND